MNILIVLVFIIGYAAIAFEHQIRLNKAASALVTGVLCWTLYIVFTENKELVNEQLLHHLGELSQILFFLMGAMTIVELIDSHDGFEIVTQKITTTKKGKLLWVIGVISFFFSHYNVPAGDTVQCGSIAIKRRLYQRLYTARRRLLPFLDVFVERD
jgi:Na+/H+ antiporter NhaD/arsenite permease-like protein